MTNGQDVKIHSIQMISWQIKLFLKKSYLIVYEILENL